MTDLAFSLRGVTKHYPHFDLRDLELDLIRGQVLGFIGPNGAGKSTTLRIMMGLVHHDEGRVEVLGHPIPAEQIQAKKRVGFAGEDLRLYSHATLAWHMAFVRRIFPSWDDAYARELVKRFDLRADQKVKGLSHGQRVKAALLLVLARRPELLLLDEPTTGLDPVARREVLGELTAVLADEERTILFSSHNTRDVEQLSDRIAFLDRGRLIEFDDKESFLDRWRRIRLQRSSGDEPLDVPGLLDVEGGGRLVTAITDRWGGSLRRDLTRAGTTVQTVEPLTLEEIFVARLATHREEAVA
ncbi:MAG: ABC transporter ATP-binding protein [Thermoanaerobaculia bacterium]|nr:ABC transporter ATP-binding protein [Thermoanaerobaculia bacterium]